MEGNYRHEKIVCDCCKKSKTTITYPMVEVNSHEIGKWFAKDYGSAKYDKKWSFNHKGDHNHRPDNCLWSYNKICPACLKLPNYMRIANYKFRLKFLVEDKEYILKQIEKNNTKLVNTTRQIKIMTTYLEKNK